MSVVVFKYPIYPGMSFVELPAGAKMLHVDVQGEQPMLWALVNPKLPAETRRIIVIGTGLGFAHADDLAYVGTFTIPFPNGPFVGHVFEPRP